MEYYFTEIENFIMKKQILEFPKDIQDKVEYLLQDGKRLRPILCIIFSGLELTQYNKKDDTANSKNIIYNIASFIEQIHCLSLVLDDLPEMDNDSMRRGKLSFHSKYSSDYTNFFIYYMFNRLFLSLNNILETNLDSNLKYKNAKILNEYIHISKKLNQLLSKNLNALLDGQFTDLQSSFSKKPHQKQLLKKPHQKQLLKKPHQNSQENILLDNKGARGAEALAMVPSIFIDEMEIILDFLEETELEETDELLLAIIRNIDLNMKKTSSLFNLSVCSGFLLQLWINKYDLENYKYNTIYKQLSIWSNILGYMFQISDDILDMEDDAIKDNPNICQIIGKENTSIILKKGCGWLLLNVKKIILECNTSLDNTDTYNYIHFNLDAIKEIIDKIVKRIET